MPKTNPQTNNAGLTREQLIAVSFPRGTNIDDDIKEQIAVLMLKRNGVFAIRKTAPKGYGPDYMVWAALKHSRHWSEWSNLASWNEGHTGRLIMAEPADRDLFHRAFDQLSCAFRDLKNETNRAHAARTRRADKLGAANK